MSLNFKPQGIYSAQWIPTDAKGQLDRGALETLIKFGRHHGIHGILALGSTGEFPQFSPAQRREVVTAIAEIGAGLPVIVNVTDIRPRISVELGVLAKEVGASAIAVMPPMFFPVSAADQLAYFLHVADAVDLPVMLYNFPELTGKRIDLETIAAFADRARMCAIKQSGGEFGYHRDLISLGREKNFVVMSGADTRLPEVFALGASGAIGGLVNIVPELMVGIYRMCVQKQAGDAKLASAQMVEVGRVIDQLTFPLNVAAGLEARGLPKGVPKMIVSGESYRIFDKIVKELGALFTHWQLAPGRDAA